MIRRIHRTIVLALVLAPLAAAPAVSAQEVPPAESLGPFVDSLMAEYDPPGGVVGVIRGGEVALREGLRDGGPGTRRSHHAETKFNLGSASKQFMAFAFALLESRGELSLDDPVSEHHLPD